jgi:hypothetical protein
LGAQHHGHLVGGFSLDVAVGHDRRGVRKTCERNKQLATCRVSGRRLDVVGAREIRRDSIDVKRVMRVMSTAGRSFRTRIGVPGVFRQQRRSNDGRCVHRTND